MKKFLAFFIFASIIFLPPLRASERTMLTYIVASNEGRDFDLDNDAYRDRLLSLFSYTSYHQVDQAVIELEKNEPQTVDLPGGYEMMLDLQTIENDRRQIHAIIRGGGAVYLDTVLSVMKPGVLFIGGPTTPEGVLIIVLEIGF